MMIDKAEYLAKDELPEQGTEVFITFVPDGRFDNCEWYCPGARVVSIGIREGLKWITGGRHGWPIRDYDEWHYRRE